MKKKVFTIIKENSERVSNKNFRDLGGRPLWRWLVDELQDFDVYINTDSKLLLDELSEFNHVTGIKRSQKHIDWEVKADQLGSPVMDMVKYFVDDYLTNNENFALVHVTSPFLKSETLKKAFDSFDSSLNHSLHSVRAVQDFMLMAKDEGVEPLNFAFDRVSRTQDLEPVYQSLGAFFIMNSATLRENNFQRLLSSSKVVPLSLMESVEIDSEDDFNFAKLLADNAR